MAKIMKNEFLQQDNFEQTGNFSLVGSFIEGSLEAAKQKQLVASMVKGGFDQGLQDMGFPSFVIPVMKLWNEKGPDILSSFSHPEELDFDKITALFNLQLYQQYMTGFYKLPLTNVLVNHYDTVPIKKSVRTPFRFGDFGSTYDLFAVGNEKTSDVSVDSGRGREVVEGFEQNIVQIKRDLFGKLENPLTQAMKEKGVFQNRREIRLGIDVIIENRLSEIGDILSTGLSERALTVADLLMKFNQEMVRRVFSLPTTLEDQFGFDSRLLSTNSDFLNLVRESIQMITEEKGVGFLKEFIGKEGEALCAIESGFGKRDLLTVVDGQFVVVGDGVARQELDDKQVEIMLSQGKPLARLESIALFAGAKTLHMGSEYGIRPIFVEKLGITGEAARYVNGLRVSPDKKHGNFGIIMKGTELSPPTPLYFVLFGKERFANLVCSQAGRTNSPLEMSQAEFLKNCANTLVDDAKTLLCKNTMQKGEEYAVIE